MKMRIGRLFKIVIVCFSLLFIMFPTVIHGEEGNVIKVGLYIQDGYHTVDEKGIHRGYAYEYLQKVASYTGWKYEYVEGTLDECIKMLENGEIDLLTGVQKTEDRIDKMYFSDAPTMYASICLLQNKEGDLSYNDYESFDGKTIGVLSGASINSDLTKFAEEHHFSYQEKDYSYSSEVLDALNNGEIDLACLINNQNFIDARIVSKFGYIQFYYALSLKRKDLLPILNDTVSQISRDNQSFLEEIYSKYYDTSDKITFTKEEQEYIDSNNKIDVALYMNAGRLFCRYDTSKNEYVGLAIDAFKMISERTGLKFEFHEIPRDISVFDYISSHPNEVIAPAFDNNMVLDKKEIELLDAIAPGRMLAVTHSNEIVNASGKIRAALVKDIVLTDNSLKQFIPHAEIIGEETEEECIKAVEDRKVDVAFVNEITGNYELQSPYYEDLQITNISAITADMTIALNKDSDPILTSILKKGISTITERDTRQLVLDNTAATSYEYSVQELIYKYRLIIIVTVIFCVVLILLKLSFDKKKRQQAKEKEALLLAEERYKADLKYQEVLFKQANFDWLTGLYNQTHFYEVVDKEMAQHPDEVYVFYRFNVEKFSLINDIYGTEAGDAVLCGIRNILKTEIGDDGIYSRLYADHFVLCTTKEIDNELLHKTVCYLNYHEQRIRVQLNVGVYERNDKKLSAAECSDYANLSLREGNRIEDGHVGIYNDSIHEKLRMNQKITNSMEDALKNGEFQVYYQAQVDIRYGNLVGAEALIRWVKADGGIISPGVFVPVFEGNRFIYQVDKFVCEQVCAQLNKWRQEGKIVPISINLSRVDLEEPDLIPMIMGNLRKYNIPIEYLHLEITESMYVQDEKNVSRVIKELRQQGFVIEMDDFGSGYSSLNMLKDITVDVLKLDMGFFKGESFSPRSCNIVESIVNMANSLGIIVIAEGVEKVDTVEFLDSIHCCIVQGYLFGKPEPIEMFDKRLKSSNVGEKMEAVSSDESSMNFYWQVETLSNIIRDYDIRVIDYDPSNDFAKIIYTDENYNRQEIFCLKYLESLQVDDKIHPDYKGILKQALTNWSQEVMTFDFLGNFNQDNHYNWYTGNAHYYYDNHQKIRIIITAIPKQ